MNAQLEALKKRLKSGNVSLGTAYDNLAKIAQAAPELRHEVFDVYKTALASKKNNNNSLNTAYYTLANIAKASPKLGNEVLQAYKIAVVSEENDGTSLKTAYDFLADIIKHAPELGQEIIETYKIALAAKNNSNYSLNTAYDVLAGITYDSPELGHKIFEVYKTALASEKNNSDSLQTIYECLANIVQPLPELRHEIMETYKIAMTSDKNDGSSLQIAYVYLAHFTKILPKLGNEVLEAYKVAVVSEKNDINSLQTLYQSLTETAKSNPEFSREIFEIYKTALASDKNDNDSLQNSCQILVETVKDFPELSPGIAEAALQSLEYYDKNDDSYDNDYDDDYDYDYDYNDNDDYDYDDDTHTLPQILPSCKQPYFILLKNCMKHCKLENLADFSQHQTELKIAHNARFCSDKELLYALQTYDIDKLADMKFMPQQRCMNVLIGSVAKEEKIDDKEAMKYRQTENEAVNKLVENNRDWLIPASFKAAELFGCYFPAYLKRTQGFLSTHDAVYWLPEKMSQKKNDSFARFLQNNIIYDTQEGIKKCRPLSELSIISQNWEELKPEEEKLKYKDILAICKSRKYKNQKFDAFAIEAAKWGIPEADYSNCEDIYKAGLMVPEPFDSSKEFKFGKYTGRFLPRDDVRTGFFGGYTDCCQHFKGVGHSCAISTVKDPYSQLFVIENDNGKIIGGSWVWENTEGKYREACFDNIEAIGEYQSNPVVNKIYEMAGRYLGEEANCRHVTIGLGYQDADTSKYKETKAIPLPSLYHEQYSDANSQVLLYENRKATPLDKSQESQRYIRDVCFLDINNMDLISEKCFPDSDRQLQTSENMSGLVLVDKDKGVVGYCLYDENAHTIDDMAVLPEYRKDKNASSMKLFGEMMRRVKNIGGEWTAELRDKTTYRFMQAMQKRGLVESETLGIDHEMSDGSKVYEVRFKPVTDKQQSGNNLRVKNRENC